MPYIKFSVPVLFHLWIILVHAHEVDIIIFHLQAETKAEEAEKRASLAEKMVQLQKNIQKPVSVVTMVCCSRKSPHPLPQSVFWGGLPPLPPYMYMYNPPEFQVLVYSFFALNLECGFETALSLGISIDSLSLNAMFCHG